MAEYWIIPTLATSIGKKTAAIGVPKIAEKAALMPHMIIMRFSSSLSLSHFILFKPAAAALPSCKAAPSLPTEPPNTCVIRVDIKIRGAITTGSSALACMVLITRLVPFDLYTPANRYKYTMIRPANGRPYKIPGYVFSKLFALMSSAENATLIPPTKRPTTVASTHQRSKLKIFTFISVTIFFNSVIKFPI